MKDAYEIIYQFLHKDTQHVTYNNHNEKSKERRKLTNRFLKVNIDELKLIKVEDLLIRVSLVAIRAWMPDD